MGKLVARSKTPSRVDDLPDGSKLVRTGIHVRKIPAPEPPVECQPTTAEFEYHKKLRNAIRRFPGNPSAAIAAAIKALKPAHRNEIQESARKQADDARKWCDEVNASPSNRFDFARNRCKSVLSQHEINYDGPMPDFLWSDGTQSIQPDPGDLTIDEQVRDACTVLKNLHGVHPTRQTELAFLAGIAFHQMLTRPFEGHVFDVTIRKPEAMKQALSANGQVYPEQEKNQALALFYKNIKAGEMVKVANKAVKDEYGISARTLRSWRQQK